MNNIIAIGVLKKNDLFYLSHNYFYSYEQIENIISKYLNSLNSDKKHFYISDKTWYFHLFSYEKISFILVSKNYFKEKFLIEIKIKNRFELNNKTIDYSFLDYLKTIIEKEKSIKEIKENLEIKKGKKKKKKEKLEKENNFQEIDNFLNSYFITEKEEKNEEENQYLNFLFKNIEFENLQDENINDLIENNNNNIFKIKENEDFKDFVNLMASEKKENIKEIISVTEEQKKIQKSEIKINKRIKKDNIKISDNKKIMPKIRIKDKLKIQVKKIEILKKQIFGKIEIKNILEETDYFFKITNNFWKNKSIINKELLIHENNYLIKQNKEGILFNKKKNSSQNKNNFHNFFLYNYKINPELIDKKTIPFLISYNIVENQKKLLYLKISINENHKKNFENFQIKIQLNKFISENMIQTTHVGNVINNCFFVILDKKDIFSEKIIVKIVVDDFDVKFLKVNCLSFVNQSFVPNFNPVLKNISDHSDVFKVEFDLEIDYELIL